MIVCTIIRYALKFFSTAVLSLKAAGYDAKGVQLIGDPDIQIADYAQKNNCDLIIVGHKHKANWAARWWGTFKSKALIEIAHCSVLIVILPSIRLSPNPIENTNI